jgi:site-specific DNA-methyltransferase (adenine-specific)
MAHMFYNQDCLEWMKTQPDNSIDTIITSPPYNLRGFRNDPKVPSGFWSKSIINYGDHDDNMLERDYQQWQIEVINECLRIMKPNGSFFYQHKVRKWNKRSSHPIEWIMQSHAKLYQEIIWNRKSTIAKDPNYLMMTNESIYWLVKGEPRVYRKQLPEQFRTTIWTISPEMNNSHPAPYPSLLPELCILLTTQPGDVVYDPFSGSGTTVAAAQKTERIGIGTELNQGFFQASEDRLQKQEINTTVFEGLFDRCH